MPTPSIVGIRMIVRLRGYTTGTASTLMCCEKATDFSPDSFSVNFPNGRSPGIMERKREIDFPFCAPILDSRPNSDSTLMRSHFPVGFQDAETLTGIPQWYSGVLSGGPVFVAAVTQPVPRAAPITLAGWVGRLPPIHFTEWGSTISSSTRVAIRCTTMRAAPARMMLRRR